MHASDEIHSFTGGCHGQGRSAPSRAHSPSGLGWVFPTFFFRRGLGRVQAELIGAQRLSVWPWACPGPPSLPSLLTYHFQMLSATSSSYHRGFTYLHPVYCVFITEIFICRLLLSPRGRYSYIFLLAPFFRFFSSFQGPLKCFSIRCCMGSGLLAHRCGPGSPGDSPPGPSDHSSLGLPRPPLAMPFAPLLLPGPRSSVLSHSLIALEHGRQSPPGEGVTAGRP